MTVPNYITFLRIIFIPLVLALLLLNLNGLAAILFMLLSFSDALDGYLARRLKQVSDLGKFLDPIADKILVISVLIALVGFGKANSIAVIIMVAREFLVSGIRIRAAQGNKIIAAIPLAKLKTFTQIIAVLMLILNVPLANTILWLAVLLSLASGGAYLWLSRILKP
ncbi:CDP-diacylglycerol--glycerol-3-phosphate 3-phosphatidyltransferase [candidate division WOR-1 bacterium RIFOXYB2_FULL_42_35]|uniref:CDP-diacylglycerol--glycerol-3-phosphate 3-phosphatidyltransferase n=1 Tax=candidate division WOR-1 bacterium RIFOXYC2_FULL_41_25 TaxID=1802586 RepID=A0A1F4TR20_UNCSA|nr:MAG: CDP-diacylglycerol--glycerol-3-phosphate 3-phosphatidyltransferase [candidate division WOR-1 bacterium RIFOXYA2_FULL_41_14]OGC25548.1 MAG: CDP-diacylglycerol--glycerol-3-phosphate 3-phosphatidyltransferase [candidate division WOR-1 bacterium RIFOXYB2_FULL_42_35]OGC34980.1 MAG: CDP-diacylglycerol--glycerol-3-phosphate 3-phosphatidyltransferase [candidate division WOR-1 bacterium RIFOXYC2_FULL_41_25]OGC42641.1 MAG: CDP-diacylglycerol--glycerol-3-phosphate 3-phosphatidyltransferase [candida